MKDENASFSFSQLEHTENISDEMNIKAFHYDKAIEEKLSTKNPLLIFECCLIDHSGKQFTCVNAHCGEDKECLKNGHLIDNLAFHKLKYQIEDRILWCTEIFPDIIRFIDTITEKELPDLRFIFNHRYIHPDDSVSQFMHEGSIQLSDNKIFTRLKLNVFAEIGDFKTDETIILTIFSYTSDLGYRKVFRKVYGGKYCSKFSQREMEIIRLCHEGYSSKMIAEKLNLSIHTVKNHKRNCMEKTLTHNITELIHLCLHNGWL